MSDYSNMWNGLEKAIKAGLGILIVTVPLAIWKAVEIGIWIAKHMEVSWK